MSMPVPSELDVTGSGVGVSAAATCCTAPAHVDDLVDASAAARSSADSPDVAQLGLAS